MTNVKITKAVGGHKEGANVNLAPSAATYLIETGYAEAVEQEPTAEKSAQKRAKKPVDNSGGGDSSDESPQTAG